MSTITINQAYQYANQAGFGGIQLAEIVAIAMAESGLQTDIRGKTDPRDRGVLQINSYWHPEVSDNCAFEPGCAFKEAYRISHGNDFHEWSTYQNGTYKQYMDKVTSTIGGNIPGWCYILGPSAGLVPACTANANGSPLPTPSQAITDPAVNAANSAGNAIYQAALKAFNDAFINPLLSALPHMGIVIGLFMFALMLVIVGFWIVASGGGSQS